MITEEFKKACEACQSKEELEAILNAHKTELTDEELQQVASGALMIVTSISRVVP